MITSKRKRGDNYKIARLYVHNLRALLLKPDWTDGYFFYGTTSGSIRIKYQTCM